MRVVKLERDGLLLVSDHRIIAPTDVPVVAPYINFLGVLGQANREVTPAAHFDKPVIFAQSELFRLELLLLVADAELASPVLSPGVDATALGVVGATDGNHMVGPASHTFEEAELGHLAELLHEALSPGPAEPELATLQCPSDEQLPKRGDHHGVVGATLYALDRLVLQAWD